MVLPLSSQWGPYRNAFDARTCLARFVDKVCGPGVGIVWAADGDIYALRAPRRDSENFADTVVFQWLPTAVIVSHKPLRDFWSRAREFINDALTAEGKALNAQGQAQIAVGQAVNRVVGRMATSHRDDGVGVALDIVCVGLSLALVPTGLGAFAALGLFGGALLLIADGTSYGMELSGNNERAEAFKSNTEKIRIFATIATLPDALWGGMKAFQELNEVTKLRSTDRVIAASADTLAARSTNIIQTKNYEQIAERAHLRSQIRSQQIVGSLKYEISPRGAGLGSALLLLKEETGNDDSSLQALFQRLQIHIVTARR
ncbi:MAG: hypothetical protein ACRYGI_17505 [Janthinobacterium lividum]